MKLLSIALLAFSTAAVLGEGKTTIEAEKPSGWLLKESDTKLKLKTCTYVREKDESNVSLKLSLEFEGSERLEISLNPLGSLKPDHLPFRSGGKTQIRDRGWLFSRGDVTIVYEGSTGVATVDYSEVKTIADFLGDTTEHRFHHYELYIGSDLRNPRRITGSIHRKKSEDSDTREKIMELDGKF